MGIIVKTSPTMQILTSVQYTNTHPDFQDLTGITLTDGFAMQIYYLTSIRSCVNWTTERNNEYTDLSIIIKY